MPLTPKGAEIKEAMEKQYGPEKGEKVFYASKNAGTITGVDEEPRRILPGDIEGGDRIYGPMFGEECRDTSAAPYSTATPPSTPPPSAISGLSQARDQPAYRQAGPETLTIEAINRRNQQFWKPEWGKKK